MNRLFATSATTKLAGGLAVKTVIGSVIRKLNLFFLLALQSGSADSCNDGLRPIFNPGSFHGLVA